MNMSVEHFECTDGDSWYSVVADGDIVTGVMHADQESAVFELFAIQFGDELLNAQPR